MCHLYASTKPYNDPMPFISHGYCRRCGKWFKVQDLHGRNRCPCCHGIVSRKPRGSKSKKKYIGVEREIKKILY